MMRYRAFVIGCLFGFLLILPAWSNVLPAAEPSDAPSGALKTVLEDQHVIGADFWVYNDLNRALLQARLENKPLFITFRCVPCEACAGFDAEVAQGNGKVQQLAREAFIPVRQVEMKGVDLSLFQFDYDLNWAAMFINADSTVYARYGTQSAEGPDAYNSLQGLENTMRRVLELHEAYPENRESLRDKRGPAKPYQTPLEMPGMENKDALRQATTRRNCIHCHMIHDAEHRGAALSGEWSEEMLWRYPLPENVGLEVDADHGIRIERVLEDSPAARAGFETGEDLLRVAGQPMTSVADIQWALHQLPPSDTVVTVEGSRSGEKSLKLSDGWKKTDISWRGSLWSVPPKLRIWMPPLGAKNRQKHSIAPEEQAFLIKWINTGEKAGQAARKIGLRQGDIVVGLAGKPLPAKLTPSQFNARIKLNYEVGEVLPLTVLRNGKRLDFELPLVE